MSTYYRVMYKRNKDVTWYTYDIQYLTWVFLPFPSLHSFWVTDYSCVEMFVGVICTCMPSFSKMLRHHEPQIRKFKTLCSSLHIHWQWPPYCSSERCHTSKAWSRTERAQGRYLTDHGWMQRAAPTTFHFWLLVSFILNFTNSFSDGFRQKVYTNIIYSK